jgi:hypothetical protein
MRYVWIIILLALSACGSKPGPYWQVDEKRFYEVDGYYCVGEVNDAGGIIADCMYNHGTVFVGLVETFQLVEE